MVSDYVGGGCGCVCMFLMIFLCFFSFACCFVFLAFACLFFKEKEKEGKGWSYTGGKVGRLWEEINEVKLIKICNMKKYLQLKTKYIYLCHTHST